MDRIPTGNECNQKHGSAEGTWVKANGGPKEEGQRSEQDQYRNGAARPGHSVEYQYADKYDSEYQNTSLNPPLEGRMWDPGFPVSQKEKHCGNDGHVGYHVRGKPSQPQHPIVAAMPRQVNHRRIEKRRRQRSDDNAEYQEDS